VEDRWLTQTGQGDLQTDQGQNDLIRTASKGDKGDKDIPQQKTGQTDASFSRPRIAILIDDIGYDMAPVKEIEEIRAPITFAILPHCPHSKQISRYLHDGQREFLLHLPMEPQAYPGVHPGAGTLLVSMTDDEIGRQFEENLKAVPDAAGVSNHMGSRFMAHEEKLSVVFRYLKKRGIFFVDSRTTPRSKGGELAGKMGVRFASRTIFLDNRPDYQTIFDRLTHLHIEKDFKSGRPLLIIGHPYPDTIRALRNAIPVMQAKGMDIVPVSAITWTGERPS
jgi:uncharacterized protein